MTHHSNPTLGSVIADARFTAQLTVRQLAEQVGVNHSQIVRIENGTTTSPAPALVTRIADALDLDVADLFALAGWQDAEVLPSFSPYLRSKYRGLPQAAQDELRQSFDAVAQKYGYDATGPVAGEDESAEQ